MDFTKINAMVDELNENFNIIEENAKALEEEKLEEYKELFWENLKYMRNFSKLLDKVKLEFVEWKFYADRNERVRKQLRIYINRQGFAEICFDSFARYKDHYTVDLSGTPNPAWYDEYFFSKKIFQNEIIPTIKGIDYGYVEEQFATKLNDMIAKKAEYLENRYNKAKER